jgi:hypothetical protein
LGHHVFAIEAFHAKEASSSVVHKNNQEGQKPCGKGINQNAFPVHPYKSNKTISHHKFLPKY